MSTRFLHLLCALLIFTGTSFAQKKPKYIFYMIGDGMGLNHVHAAELYLAAQDKKNSTYPLVFSQFPFNTFATSHSLSHGVTDSGAGGTALAVGYKTKNGVIAMDSTGQTEYKSIAYLAKEQGMKVGITTSVSIDHATPASFYANQPNRGHYYEIGKDILKSNFDFFGGAGFVRPETDKNKNQVEPLFSQFEKAGYQLAYGISELKDVDHSGKVILMNNPGENSESLSYAIDQQEGALTLEQITDAAINNLSKGDQGFFLMVEGGMIDWASHANDAATAVKEVLDFNKSVERAYEFYKQHPDETLIIVTADHETGGLMIGNGSSTLHIHNLAHQKISEGQLSALLREFRKSTPDASWEDLQRFLTSHTGLWEKVKVSSEDETQLKAAYEASFIANKNETEKSLYATNDRIAALAIKTLNKASSLAWASGGHSAAYIPVYAIGVGAEHFTHKMDNIDIPRTVSKIAGWQHP
ncbi:MAG TPA: alkaline phosphatase [Candidatus Sphingobacterium stercorigallinarum]|nr:alkaline phosphatase [Candidatus Sphingobacterium stercorigallinarum]